MITPSDSPSSPGNYAGVTPHGRGPAPYDIQAPQADLSGVFREAGMLSGGQENDIYPQGPRQHETEALIMSAPGYGDFDITAGFAGSHGETWPGDATP